MPAPISGRASRVLRLVTTITVVALGVSATACNDPARTTGVDAAPSVHRQYGVPTPLGNGRVRTYVTIDQKKNAPTEIGVAFDEGALQGLPDTVNSHGGDSGMLLPLPAQNATPYRLVELDWNPHGHEPDGVYTLPHFDFHFYTITQAERAAINPAAMSAADYTAKSNSLPPTGERPAYYVPLGAPDVPLSAVPMMGVHWADVRAPELQAVFGHPENARPFVTTYLHGSWDGRFIFDEPMITRAFILSRKTSLTRDTVIAVSVAQQFRQSGYYPSAYSVTYDAQAREYRVALTQLAQR